MLICPKLRRQILVHVWSKLTPPRCSRWVPAAKILYDSANRAQATLAHRLRRCGVVLVVAPYFIPDDTLIPRYERIYQSRNCGMFERGAARSPGKASLRSGEQVGLA